MDGSHLHPIPHAHSPPVQPLSQRASVPHLVSLLASALVPSCPTLSVPLPLSSSRGRSLAFDLLLNRSLPYRYACDDDDSLALPSSLPSHPSLPEERCEQEDSPPLPSQSPRRWVRLHDEWQAYLFLLRTHGHFDRANAVQLLVSRLREQRRVTVPSALLSPSSGSTPSSSVTLPFTSASAVLALLLELAGCAETWNAIPAPLLGELHRSYQDPSLSSTFVLPPPSSAFPSDTLSSSPSAAVDSDGEAWHNAAYEPPLPSDDVPSVTLVEDAWTIEKRLLSSSAKFHPPLPSSLNEWDLQEESLGRSALFSFQKDGTEKPAHGESNVWAFSLSPSAPPETPSSFFHVALLHAAEDAARRQRLDSRERVKQWKFNPEATRFTEAWREHRARLLQAASPSTLELANDTVWQQVGTAPPPSPTVASSLLDSFSSNSDDDSRSSSLAHLALFSHPVHFYRLHTSTLSSLFTSTAQSSPAASPFDLTQVEADAVRCSLFVLQAIPSTLYSLLSSSAEFTICTSPGVRFPGSFLHIMRDCAEVGTQLYRIERLAEALPSTCVISQGLASALVLFSSRFKQQVAELPYAAAERRRGATAEASALTLSLLELHCHLQSLQQHLAWLYQLLHRPLSVVPSSPNAPSPLPSGPALLSFLYLRCLTLSTDSPFFPTLTSLFQSALTPFLLLLHDFLYNAQLSGSHDNLRRLTAPRADEAGLQQLWLPVFLTGEEQKLEAAGRQLRLLVDGAASEWALSCDDCGVPVLQVAYSVRDVDRICRWREELHCQQEARLHRLEEGEARKMQVARELRLAQRRAAAASAKRGVAIEEEEEQEGIEKRRRQRLYQQELDAQLREKAKRAEEERQREEQEREAEGQRKLKEQRIIEEEKVELLAQIKAVEEGITERQMQREEWRKKRLERGDVLASFLQREEADWTERLPRPDDASTVASPDNGVNDGEEEGQRSPDDYHTDDEGVSTRSQSPSLSEVQSPASRPAPLSSTQRRGFRFDYDSPASPSTARSSPHFFSPSPRHAPTDTDESDHPNLSAFRIPSPVDGHPSRASDHVGGEIEQERSADGGRRFVFEAVPSPKSGLDSGASPSLQPSPRHHRRLASVDSLSSGVTNSSSEGDTPRSQEPPPTQAEASRTPSPFTSAKSHAKSQLEQETQSSAEEKEVKQGVDGSGAVEYDWDAPSDGSVAVDEERAYGARDAAKPGEDGDEGWTKEEEQQRQIPVAPATALSNDEPSSSSSSQSAGQVAPIVELHAEGGRSRALNRERNTRSLVTFASAEDGGPGETEEAQSELIRLMAAKEAQRASNEARGLARERNVRSQVFDAGAGDEQGRREESSPLKSNRQRMMASSIFPEPLIEEKISSQPPKEEDAEPRPLPSPSPVPVEAKTSESELTGGVDDLQEAQVKGLGSPEEEPLPIAPQAPAAVAEVNSAHRLPLDVAVRCSLLPALRQQVSMIERATLSFFLHSLRIDSHLQSLNHFFLMKAGDLLDTFTASLFACIKQQPSIPLTPPTLLHLWQAALELCPPPPSLLLHPSLISFSLSSSPPAPSLNRVDGMEAVDAIRMEYRVSHPASVVVSEGVVAQYGRVCNLLLRVLWVRSEMRELFLWMRAQDGDIRRKEAQHRLTIQRSQTKPAILPSSSAHRSQRPSPATDDLVLLSPTKRRPPAGSPPSITGARDDDVYHRQRVEVEGARRGLEGLVHARWRLRWLHAVRAEMVHVLTTIHHHLHVSCIATLSSSLFSHFHPPTTLTSLSHLQAVHATFLTSLLSSTFLSSPSSLASLLEAVLSTILAFAQSLSPLTLHSPVQAEQWQSLRDVAAQFRGHGTFLARLLRVVREEGVAEEAVQSMEATLDYNHFFTRLRQRELEATVLS